jgi:regulator of CtrA degradation
MSDGKAKPPVHIDTAFIEKTYDEAMALVQRSALYLEGEGARLQEELGEELGVVFTAESLRVTTRLMQVVAWLMVRRAVLAGEMTADEAHQSKHRLGARDICRAQPLEGTRYLPQTFLDLEGESRTLYERIARLEEGENTEKADNPVHTLLNRLSGI